MLQRLFAPGWPGHLLALAAGPLVTLSLAPFGVAPAGLLALALLALLLDRLTPAQAFARGWWFGAGFWLAGASWVYVSIHVYGYASVPLALALTLGYCLGLALLQALFAWSYARFVRERPTGRWLGFAGLWVLWEWFRSWALTGFPWLYVGYAHLDGPLAGWVPVGGVFAAGLIVALTAAALAPWLMPRWFTPRRSRIALGTALALWLSGWGLAQIDWVDAKGEPVTVALVQANVPQQLKWDADFYRQTLSLYRELSAPLWDKAQIIVWPEAAIPAFYDQARDFVDAEAASAAQHDHALIVGIPTRERHGDANLIRNSILALGEGRGIYHKQRLVPFGEYVPLEQWLRGLIRFLDMPMSAFSAGPAGQLPLRAAGLKLGPLICYEVVYPDLVAEWLPHSDVLITISNDAWFGRSIGPLQHLQMAQMRALEAGRPMIRGTGNGVTALIDHRGRITARAPQFERTTLTGTIQPMQGATPFARTGVWPSIVLAGIFAIGGYFGGRRRTL
jgi:apolipoprotein N-acyltransferase